MDSMLSGMKRAAAVLQTTARGSGDLGMVIYHQKEVAESWSRLTSAKLDATKAFATWGKSEGEAMMQFFENQNQLEGIYINLVDEMVKKYDYNRKCYKEILRGEKILEDLMERKKECEVKLAKITKQYEGSRKGKQKNLEAELGKAKSNLVQAGEELDLHQKNHARFKFQKLAEAYKDNAAIHLKFHSDARTVAQAQAQLNQIFLQENFTHLSSQKLHAVTVEAQTVLNDLTEALNNSKISSLQSQGSRRSNTSSDGVWQDFDDEYSDNPHQEIRDAPDMVMNANRPLPPVPAGTQDPAVYDNNPGGEYLEMDYADYETYAEGRPLQRSDQYLNVYEPLQKSKEPAAKPLGDLMAEMKLDNQQNQSYLTMRSPATPNPYGPSPTRTSQAGQLYPNIDPESSPPDGAEFLPPPPPELMTKADDGVYDNTGPHEYV